MNKRPEILAPAGSPEALTAAVRCGADAVYLGAGNFNARQNAHNFTTAALREAVAYCHSRDVKVYLTLNTLIRQEELTPVMAVVEQACGLGIDALIIQDLGLAALVRRAAPDMPLHASTQLSCHTPVGVGWCWLGKCPLEKSLPVWDRAAKSKCLFMGPCVCAYPVNAICLPCWAAAAATVVYAPSPAVCPSPPRRRRLAVATVR